MSWLTEILKDFPALSVAHERLALIAERLSEAERKNETLIAELDKVTAERDALLATANAAEKSSRFVEHYGVCWQIHEEEVERIAYCPKCNLAMHEFPPDADETLLCSVCNFVAPFHPSEIEAAAKSLEIRLLTL